MKSRQMKTILLAMAVACSMSIAGCGSTGSISSLTDNDSTAALTDDAAAAASADTAAGTVTKAEEETTDNTAVLPEIEAQTIDAGAVDEDGEAVSADSSADGAEADSETDGTAEAASSAATEDDDVDDVSYENDDDPEAVAAADAIDVAETDEGGVHGEGNYATVIGDEVNVRSYPEVDEDDDNVLGTLSYGDEVIVLGNEDGWYKIEFEGEIGYASANYFA